MTNAPGKDAYPIAVRHGCWFTNSRKIATKGKKLVEFLKWALNDGEKMAKDLDYAPLPEECPAARPETDRRNQILIDLASELACN